MVVNTLFCALLTRDSKRGVSELAQSFAVFVNLQILEIRENPGVGGVSLPSHPPTHLLGPLSSNLMLPLQCTLVSLPRVFNIVGT
jgi:hypothetical protein